MALIFGKISLETIFGEKERLLEKLKASVTWQDCIYQEINYAEFSGGLVINNCHPYTPEDFFYLDSKNEVLVFMSGVIYNKNEILEKLGITSKNISDPELILRTFLKNGENFVNELNGDFGIIIYPRNKREVYIYRDHFGIRPLSITVINDTLIFSSDLIGLSKALFFEEKIEEQYFYQSLLNPAYWNYNIVPNKKVIKILPGHYINYSKKGLKEIRYWRPEVIKVDNRIEFSSAKKNLEYLLEDAVRIRCDSRFHAASHLSGGLDSGYVSALSKKNITQKEYYGFSWTPDKKVNEHIPFDERELVKRICDFSGIIPYFVNFTESDYIKTLSDWRYFHIDDFQEVNVINAARSKGINLLFSGWGGDDFVSINHKGINSDLFFGLHWCLLKKRASSKSVKALLSLLKRTVIFPALGIKPAFEYSTHYDFSKYLKFDLTSYCKPALNVFSYKSRKKVHLNFIKHYHLANRTEDASIKGYHRGIEYRYPLLDKRIVEYIISLPSKILVKGNWSRIMLRELSMGLLPDEVRWHMPKSDWVRGICAQKLGAETSKFYLDQVEIFKKNPYLQFVDFDLIKKDVDNYINHADREQFPDSLRILIYLKKIDVFVKEYHIGYDFKNRNL